MIKNNFLGVVLLFHQQNMAPQKLASISLCQNLGASRISDQAIIDQLGVDYRLVKKHAEIEPYLVIFA